MRTAYFELTEGEPSVFLATWDPRSPTADPYLTPRFPAACEITSHQRARSAQETFLVRCDGPIAGRSFGVDGLGPLVGEAVFRIAFRDGSSASQVLTPHSPTWTVPSAPLQVEVAFSYLGFGLQHILTGADHLLFLLALALCTTRFRELLVISGAFTVAHSVTLGATAMRVIEVSSAAAEVCIAWSLVLIALDIHPRDSPDRARWARPGAAGAFGLVHGFGFASALREVGLPPEDIPLALVSFNVGIELGQVLFLGPLAALARLTARRGQSARLGAAGAYAVGGMGAYWVIDRSWSLFGAHL
ncbi:MAG: HupE/UreJ family protein [bacterium]